MWSWLRMVEGLGCRVGQSGSLAGLASENRLECIADLVLGLLVGIPLVMWDTYTAVLTSGCWIRMKMAHAK